MKTAVATDGEYVAGHFGHCSSYTIFETAEQKITGKAMVDAPPHQPGVLPRFLKEKGVDTVVAGGMGMRAQKLFREFNIEPYVGVVGKVDQVVMDLLEGKLVAGESTCTHGAGHGDGHAHEHDHKHNCGGHHGACHGHGEGNQNGCGHN